MCAKLILLLKKMRNRLKQEINALDVYTKINIKDYLARPYKKFDKEYSEERQKIRKYIREDDFAAKPYGGVIVWNYLLNASNIF